MDDGAVVGEATEEIGTRRIIRCTGSNIGVECMIQCNMAGIVCTAGEPHPYKADGGTGLLFLCSAATPRAVCVYYYESTDDECWFVPRIPFPLCKYAGGKP